MFATKLKVASALFLCSFIVWVGLILLAAKPTENFGRIQFSNFLILALFLGSAITASLSSMLIGLDLIELKMRPLSLAKKFGRGRLSIRTRKSATAQKSRAKDSTLQPEKIQASQTELDVKTPYLEEEIVLPDRSLSSDKEVVIKKPKEGDKSAEKDVVQFKANMLSQPPEIKTCLEPTREREIQPASAKRDSEVDSRDIYCPKCNNVFTIALLSLDFGSGKARMVRSCPRCYTPLEILEDKETQSAKVTGDRKFRERSTDEQKAFLLFGETEFKGCKFKSGYLGSLPKNKPIPDECFGCPQLVECFQTLKIIR
jgi:hypothetical protein